MRRLVFLMVLAGCQATGPVEVQPQATAQSASLPDGILRSAEQVTLRAVEGGHPQLNPTVAATCIKDNATNPELLVLADGMLHSTTSEEAEIIATILGRPVTQTCLSDAGQTVNG